MRRSEKRSYEHSYIRHFLAVSMTTTKWLLLNTRKARVQNSEGIEGKSLIKDTRNVAMSEQKWMGK